MNNFQEYLIQLKRYVDDNNLTSAQAEAVTKQQVANLLSVSVDALFWSGSNIGFFTNLLQNVVVYIIEKEQQADKQFIQNALNSSAYTTRFPNAEFAWDSRIKRLEIYPYGRAS